MSSYRFPADMKPSGRRDSKFTLAVTCPPPKRASSAESAHLVGGTFRIASDDSEALPDEQKLWCVHSGGASTTAIGSRSDSRCDPLKGDQT